MTFSLRSSAVGLGFGLGLTLLGTTSLAAPPSSTATRALAIVNVRVFDGDKVIPRANVIVRDGKIVEVSPTAAIPVGAETVDGTGKTLLPGLIDAHVHSWGDARVDALRFGVTTELDMFSDWHQLADAKKERESLAPTNRADLWSSGTLATVAGGHGTEYGMTIPTLTTPAEAQPWVDARVKEGADYIKLVLDDGSAYGPKVHLPTLTADEVKALIVAAHKDGKLAVIHIARLADARLAIADGVDGLAHVFIDAMQPGDDQLITLAKEGHVFVTPTLTVYASSAGSGLAAKLRDDARLAPYLSADQKTALGQSFPRPHPDFLQKASENTRRLYVGGVPILAGTDAGNPGTTHGASLHSELELLVAAKLPPVAALTAATATPARIYHLSDRGRIAAGLRADLLLVDGDPTTDITATRAIARIWKNGHAVERTLPSAIADSKAQAVPAAPLISDFDGATLTAAYGHGWENTTDQLAGGRSAVVSKLVPGGANGSKGALDVTGETMAGFAFPWAGVMFFPSKQMNQPVDLSSKKEIVFWAKGDGRDYAVMLFSGSNPRMPVVQKFTAGPTWKAVHLPLSGFTGGDPARVYGLAYTAGQPLGKFNFQIDQVEIR